MLLKQLTHFSVRWCLAAVTLLLSTVTLASEPVTTGWLSHPDHPPVQVKLSLTGERDGTTANALLQVELDEGWKTYWRSPGEGGIPPQLDWSDATGIRTIDWFWPKPARYTIQGIDTVGYTGSLNFPLQLQVAPDAEQVHLKGTLTMSSCTNICVLTDYPIDLNIDTAALTPDADLSFAFQQAMAQVPQALPLAEVTQANWHQASTTLDLALTRDSAWQAPELFFHSEQEALEDVVFNSVAMTVEQDQLRAQITASHWLELPDLAGQSVTVTVVDGDFAAAYPITFNAVEGAAHSPLLDSSPSLAWMLVLALLGGLILNIMPCVLPVLGLKLQGVISANGQSASVTRKQFIASALGILVSFWLLAIGLLLLRWSGQSIGWGIQFQSPYFIGFMVSVTWLFALNLFGAFEVKLPSAMGSWAATTGDQHSYSGHFVQGMLATLLATPCTAPFLGTAVAFALAAAPGTILLMFTALGVGMALPWLAVAIWPRLARLLPKPGPWLAWVKPIFGVLMLLTMLWLISLMQSFISTTTLILIVLVLFAFSLVAVWRQFGRKGLLITLSGSFLGGALLIVLLLLNLSSWAPKLPEDHQWRDLLQTDIDAEVAQGNTVFVDVTADWCITCKANKIGVLLQNPVYDALGAEQVVRVRGDWTVPIDAIDAYLKQNNTYGVPFNKVYGPNAPEGIVLPIILTDQEVLDALAQASANTSSETKE